MGSVLAGGASNSAISADNDNLLFMDQGQSPLENSGVIRTPPFHLAESKDLEGPGNSGMIGSRNMSNIEIIRELYAAFARGDVEAILARLSESVEWEYGPTSTNVPWLQPRHGRKGAAGFFASLAEMELHKFQPKEFLEAPGVVVVLSDVDLTVKATGKRVTEEDEIHVWRFDEEGKIVRYRHGVDTHLHQLAYNPA